MIAFQRLHPRSLAAITIVAAVCGAGSTHPVWGQGWQTSGSNVYVTSANVGIGTTTPTSKLQIDTSNSVGIDGTAPLILNRIYDSVGDYQDIVFGDGGSPLKRGGIIRSLAVGGGETGFAFLTQTGAGDAGTHESVRILGNGNVGIGTTAPQHRLSVNGTIGAKEVIVTNSGWADHVFQAGYRVMPLREVASYIEEHGHLPEIPSETEVQKNGIGVGEMQAKLLAKIEELTLHMIQMERQNRELQDRIACLEAGNTSKAGASQGGAQND